MKSITGYLFGIVVLLAAAKFGDLLAENILELRRLEALHAQAQHEVWNLETGNFQLAAEARSLEEDPFYVELTIRRRLRWTRPEEAPRDYHRPQPYAPDRALLASVQQRADSMPRQHDNQGHTLLASIDIHLNHIQNR